MRVVELVRHLLHFEDRRKQEVPVIKERRKERMHHAEARLLDSIKRLDKTVTMRREDFFRDNTVGILNGIRREVQFTTFADICRHAGSKDLTIRLCRHPEHAAANTGIAKCDESVCPEMIKASR